MSDMMITDFITWLLDYGDRIYRFLVYKKMFTPYEQKQAFSDESVYEDTYYQFCRIEEAIAIDDGDWLLGLRILNEDLENTSVIEYYKLSEIRLSHYEDDKEDEDD